MIICKWDISHDYMLFIIIRTKQMWWITEFVLNWVKCTSSIKLKINWIEQTSNVLNTVLRHQTRWLKLVNKGRGAVLRRQKMWDQSRHRKRYANVTLANHCNWKFWWITIAHFETNKHLLHRNTSPIWIWINKKK